MLKAGTGAIQKWVVADALTDPYVVVYAARVSVWGRWFVWLVLVFQLLYRPGFWYPEDIEYLSIPVLLFMANGLVHHRLLTNRPVTWRWMLFLSATDLALTTVGVVIGGGFKSFVFLAYYPALAVFALVFSSRWLSLAWTTAAAVAYAAVCLMAGSGLDLGAGNEKVLVARLALMYTMVAGISFITRFERIRWRTAVASERQLLRERIELSQTIHDTTAQTAYMIGPGHSPGQEPGWRVEPGTEGRPGRDPGAGDVRNVGSVWARCGRVCPRWWCRRTETQGTTRRRWTGVRLASR